jgi:hypothetical protein
MCIDEINLRSRYLAGIVFKIVKLAFAWPCQQ